MADRAVQRDLLPLPFLPDPGISTACARWSRQRFGRHAAVVRGVNRAVWSLNELWGNQFCEGVRPSAAQTSAMNRIHELVSLDRPGDADMAPEAALQALLGQKAAFGYSAEGSSTVADYARDLVSLPFDAGGCDLYHSLPNSERHSVGVDFNRIFRSAEHVESNSGCPLPPIYWDKVLDSDRSIYAGLVKDLLARGMI